MLNVNETKWRSDTEQIRYLKTKNYCFIVPENYEIECEDCKKKLCNNEELEDHICHTEDDPQAIHMCNKCNVFFKT